MKTDPIQGIMNYYWRMIQFQTYLETTWAAMEAIESTSKTVLFDLKLRENLAGAIFMDQMSDGKIGWKQAQDLDQTVQQIDFEIGLLQKSTMSRLRGKSQPC